MVRKRSSWLRWLLAGVGLLLLVGAGLFTGFALFVGGRDAVSLLLGGWSVTISRVPTPMAPMPDEAASPAVPTMTPTATVNDVSSSPTPARPFATTPSPVPPEALYANGDDLLALVNKKIGLRSDYEPPDLVELTGVPTVYAGQRLRREAADYLRLMFDAAAAQGLEMVVLSAYRSYEEQARTFDFWVRQEGLAAAERESARPGHSQHQLGTAVDITSKQVGYSLVEGFGSSAEGSWLEANAHRFGFIMSYPKDEEAITGYKYEPWHFRYVGREHAAAVYQGGLVLEEYLSFKDEE